jgi:hypothetical protein
MILMTQRGVILAMGVMTHRDTREVQGGGTCVRCGVELSFQSEFSARPASQPWRNAIGELLKPSIWTGRFFILSGRCKVVLSERGGVA